MERLLVASLAIVAFGAFAQAPVSGLRGNAPQVRNSVTPAQQLVVPADLAKLDDNAIIIIGGKPTAVGEVKRIVRSLDDTAIIIIGGNPTAAGDVKRQLDAAHAQQKVDSRTASPSTLSPWPAPAAGTKALSAPADRTSFGIHEIDPGVVYQNQKFVIHGIGLGDRVGTVEIAWYDPYLSAAMPIRVNATRWTSTRIDAAVPAPLPWLDPSWHHVTLVVTTASGERFMSPMNLYYLQSKGSP